MQKIKLIIADSNLCKHWFVPLWNQFFDWEVYDPNGVYSTDSIIIADNRYGETQRFKTINAHGCRMILPYLMDSYIDETSETTDRNLILRSRDWIWIQESLNWRSRNYHTYPGVRDPSRFFLMLLNLRRDHRDRLVQAVTPYLSHSTYSYVERGIRLPGDVVDRAFDDRFFVADWYSQTCFSLVSETSIYNDLFISEKVFKPMAFYHPMIVYGTPGTLKHLHSLGFETFGHVVDESYDAELDHRTRLEKIVAVLDQLFQEYVSKGQVFFDAQTQQKLIHNHERFFDLNEVHTRFQNQIVEPIMNWAES